MSIRVQLLSESDFPLLLEVDDDVFDDPIDKRAAEAFLADPNHLLAVAMDEERAARIVAMASAVLYRHPDKPAPELWINEVGVAEDYRGRGIGKELLAALFKAAKKAGCRQAWTLTEHDNDAAIALYKAAGGDPPSDALMIEFNLFADD